jgi:hypothetical protein
VKYTVFRGIKICIENPAGSTRSGVDKQSGKPWSTVLSHDYGYIVGTTGADGDAIDVFLGPDTSAKFVYIIHQTDKQGTQWDEDKCMLGFPDVLAAKEAYFKNYDLPNHFYGSVTVCPLKEFKQRIKEESNKMLFSSTFGVGDQVYVHGFHGRGVVMKVKGTRANIRFRNGENISRDFMYLTNLADREPSMFPTSVKATHDPDDPDATITHEAYKDVQWEVDRKTGEILPPDDHNGRERKHFRKLIRKQKHVGGLVEAKEENVELETSPNPPKGKKRIVKQGTQYCVVSDSGVDRSFGCYPSREMGQAVADRKSFIEPSLPKNLFAGGPGSGRKKQAMKEYQRIYQLAKQAGMKHEDAHKEATSAYVEKMTRMYAGKVIRQSPSEFKKSERRAGIEPYVDAGGPGSGRHPSYGKFKEGFKSTSNQYYTARGHQVNVVKHPTDVGHVKVTEITNAPRATGNKLERIGYYTQHNAEQDKEQSFKVALNDLKTFLSERYGIGGETTIKAGGPGSGRKSSAKGLNQWKSPEKERALAHKNKNQLKLFPDRSDKLIRPPKIAAFGDQGEPMAGAQSWGYIDPMTWFAPPSLAKRGKGQKVPVDDPQEKDNKFMDVQRRNSKDTKEQRMKLLKRSKPGGIPPMVPVRTTAIATPSAYYASALRNRRRRINGGGMFRAFGAAAI